MVVAGVCSISAVCLVPCLLIPLHMSSIQYILCAREGLGLPVVSQHAKPRKLAGPSLFAGIFSRPVPSIQLSCALLSLTHSLTHSLTLSPAHNVTRSLTPSALETLAHRPVALDRESHETGRHRKDLGFCISGICQPQPPNALKIALVRHCHCDFTSPKRPSETRTTSSPTTTHQYNSDLHRQYIFQQRSRQSPAMASRE